MNDRITVVIPFFQRRAGILTRTLAGVFAQDTEIPISVLIVDDSSPITAASEVANCDASWKDRIQIIRQPNGGPGNARNTGIEAALPDATFIALSDSDDIWPETHLSDAMAAMSLGYDFFFGDCLRESKNERQFVAVGLDTIHHRLIDASRSLFAWQGDFLDAVLRSPLAGLSTIVFRAQRLGHLRFRTDLGIADDLYFAIDVALETSNIAFSARIQAIYGQGENISIVTDWRSNKALETIVSLARFNRAALDVPPLTQRQQTFLRQRLRQVQRDFAAVVPAMLLAGVPINTRLVKSFVAEQPAAVAQIFPALIHYMRQKFRH